MKFSKLVMLPLLALGLAACTPSAPSTPSEVVPSTSEPAPVPTDWTDETKALMVNNLGFVMPFFHLDGGDWYDDPSQGFSYMSNPEGDLTQKDLEQKVLIPLLQAGMIDSTMNWQFGDSLEALKPLVFGYVDVQETQTKVYNIIIVYLANNAFGEGTKGGMMIVAGPDEPAYTDRDVTDEEQATLVKQAFGEECTLVLPSLESFKKAAYVNIGAEPNVGVMFAFGYCASKDNLDEIAKIYADAGWVVNAEEGKMLYNIYDKTEDPEWMGIIGGFPDGTIRIIINPFSI